VSARFLLLGVIATAACTEYRVRGDDPVPPADPPARLPDAQGAPPTDWDACARGFLGRYHNLAPGDVAVADPSPEDPESVDWWRDETLAFSRYDPSLDFGENWWPVDDGTTGDPGQFAVRWTAWLRVRDRTLVQVVLGAADDAWVRIGDDVVASQRDRDVMEAGVFDVTLAPGVYPVDVRFAHRIAQRSGVRVRLLGEPTLCYPEI